MSDIILYTLVIFAIGFFCGSKFRTPSEMFNKAKEGADGVFKK
jgi:hypothetical protein